MICCQWKAGSAAWAGCRRAPSTWTRRSMMCVLCHRFRACAGVFLCCQDDCWLSINAFHHHSSSLPSSCATAASCPTSLRCGLAGTHRACHALQLFEDCGSACCVKMWSGTLLAALPRAYCTGHVLATHWVACSLIMHTNPGPVCGNCQTRPVCSRQCYWELGQTHLHVYPAGHGVAWASA